MNCPSRTATSPRTRDGILRSAVIVDSLMIVTVTVIIRPVNTIESGYIDGMPNSRTIPHLTRLSRRVNGRATEESLGMNLKQVYMLASLRDNGALPQTTLCDMM